MRMEEKNIGYLSGSDKILAEILKEIQKIEAQKRIEEARPVWQMQY